MAVINAKLGLAKAMKTAAILMLLLTALCSTVTAAESDLEKALTSKYKEQVLILRHPVQGDSLRFNSTGELLTLGHEAPWTIDGAIVITDVHVTAKTLTIKGKRRWYGFDPRLQRLLPAKTKWKDRIKIEVGLDHPLKDLAESGAVLDRIFVRNEQELIDVVPEYWRSFLAKQYGIGDVAKAAGETTASENARHQIVKLDPKTVKHPEAVFTPAPDLLDSDTRSIPEVADYVIRGVVVLDVVIDSTGKVLDPRIVRPVGFGLDEKAIAAVRNWKFKPATRNGEPVAVEMGLEVQFNIN